VVSNGRYLRLNLLGVQETRWGQTNLRARGAKIVISQHPRRSRPLAIDLEIYKWRHLIENFFCKLKEFKRIAMRADKTDQSFSAMIYLTAAVVNSR
jgi:transposase